MSGHLVPSLLAIFEFLVPAIMLSDGWSTFYSVFHRSFAIKLLRLPNLSYQSEAFVGQNMLVLELISVISSFFLDILVKSFKASCNKSREKIHE